MRAPSDDQTLEAALLRAFPWLVAALVLSAALLVLPPAGDRRWDLLVHLTALVAFSFALTFALASYGDAPWFDGRGWPVARRRFVTAVTLIVIVTGVTGLVTMASAAAMQYQPSLQFLQLLSALDIAWVVAGTTLALRSLWGNVAAAAGGTMMSIVCVLSIALYLTEVGLAPDQGWQVDGAEMLRLVLPFDVGAALITIGLTVLASRHTSGDVAG